MTKIKCMTVGDIRSIISEMDDAVPVFICEEEEKASAIFGNVSLVQEAFIVHSENVPRRLVLVKGKRPLVDNYVALFGSQEATAMTLERIMHDDEYASVLGIDECDTVLDFLLWLKDGIEVE